MKNDLLIPFDLHVKGHHGKCRDVLREKYEKAGALVEENDRLFISYNRFSTSSFIRLDGMIEASREDESNHVIKYYALFARDMLTEWSGFCTDLLKMGASVSETSEPKLATEFSDIREDLRFIFNHFINAITRLFATGTPVADVDVMDLYGDITK